MPSPVVQVDVEGVRGLVREADVAALLRASPDYAPRLLPGFDPFTNELPRHVDAVLDDRLHDRVHRTAGWVTPIVVLDGRVGGTWELETGKGGAGRLVVQTFGRWRGGARKELEPEVDRLSAYLERRLTLEVERSG
jgi:hypothetical protein